VACAVRTVLSAARVATQAGATGCGGGARGLSGRGGVLLRHHLRSSGAAAWPPARRMAGMTDSALPFKKQKSHALQSDVATKRLKTDVCALAVAAVPASAAVFDVAAPLLDLGELVPATLVARPRCGG
jgi:hypothetical protein